MSSSIEKQSLEVHVDLCAARYEDLQQDIINVTRRIERLEDGMADRMDKLESIVIEIKENLSAKETSALKTLVGVGLAIIASLIGTVGGLIWYVITKM